MSRNLLCRKGTEICLPSLLSAGIKGVCHLIQVHGKNEEERWRQYLRSKWWHQWLRVVTGSDALLRETTKSEFQSHWLLELSKVGRTQGAEFLWQRLEDYLKPRGVGREFKINNRKYKRIKILSPSPHQEMSKKRKTPGTVSERKVNDLGSVSPPRNPSSYKTLEIHEFIRWQFNK